MKLLQADFALCDARNALQREKDTKIVTEVINKHKASGCDDLEALNATLETTGLVPFQLEVM